MLNYRDCFKVGVHSTLVQNCNHVLSNDVRTFPGIEYYFVICGHLKVIINLFWFLLNSLRVKENSFVQKYSRLF